MIFKGLAEQVQLELLLGLQLRTDAGIRTLVTALRPVVAVLRRTEAASLDELDESLIKQTRHDASVLARHLVTAVQRATTSPDEEQRNDVWDLAVLGLARLARLHRDQPGMAARDRQAVGRGGTSAAPRPPGRPDCQGTSSPFSARCPPACERHAETITVRTLRR